MGFIIGIFVALLATTAFTLSVIIDFYLASKQDNTEDKRRLYGSGVLVIAGWFFMIITLGIIYLSSSQNSQNRCKVVTRTLSTIDPNVLHIIESRKVV